MPCKKHKSRKQRNLCQATKRKGQFGGFLAIVLFILAAILLAYFWPTLSDAMAYAQAAEMSPEGKLLWGVLGALILLMFYLGTLYRNFSGQKPPQYQGFGKG